MEKINDAIKVAVLGASGYTGKALLECLFSHPSVTLVAATSRTFIGQSLAQVFPQFLGLAQAELCCSDHAPEPIIEAGVDVVFLALPHGTAAQYAIKFLDAGIKVIDLSADFRLNELATYQEFYGEHPAPQWLKKSVYGLTQSYATQITQAQLIANPGCYPTSSLIPLLPLLKAGLIEPDSIIISSMSGVSGAGRSASIPLLFSECYDSCRAYGLPKHRHLSEIEQELSLAADTNVTVTFAPHLVPVKSGMLTTIFATPTAQATPEAVTAAYQLAYADSSTVRLLGEGGLADTKAVVNHHWLDMGWHFDTRNNKIILSSAIDNLMKGASSQAIENMNLMYGLPTATGLIPNV